MRLAWVTDIHLDFLGESSLERFCRGVADTGADGVLVGGDTAQAASLERMLRLMSLRIRKPIWFVLGNHDFYGGSIADVRQRARNLSHPGRLVWLGAVDAVELTSTAALVGHDGWGDARLGDHAGSTVVLNDFLRIGDFIHVDKPELGCRLAELGDEAAAHLRRVLPPALERYEHVLVLTHVPPFRQAAWHLGAISEEDWLPYFSCKATGDVLLEVAARRPDRLVTVLCGHTHSSGFYQPAPNLRVHTGGAAYGSPIVQLPLLEV
jgi:Icc protein